MILSVVGLAWFTSNLLFVRSSSPDFGKTYSCERIYIKNGNITKFSFPMPGGPWDKLRCGASLVIGVRSSNRREIVAIWPNGVISESQTPSDVVDIQIASDGRYAFVSERMDSRNSLRTEVFALGHDSLRRIQVLPGKVYAILDNQAFATDYVDSKHLKGFSKALGLVEDKGLSLNVQKLFTSRTKFLLRDKFRSSNFEDIRPPINFYRQANNIAVSSRGEFWFEKALREYIVSGENSARQFAGHVVFDQQGMVGQWKFHRDTLRGAFFISPTVLRTFWMEEFLYGKKSLNWYEPGVYDLNLKSNTLTKISVNFPNLNQFDGFYLVDPGSA